MRISGTVHSNFQRVITMAQACSVDLSTALDQRQIDAEAYTDMVIGCRNCSQSDHCDRLLATQPSLAQAPDYCVNREQFTHLHDLQTR